MGFIRKIYNAASFLLPISYLTLVIDNRDIELLVLWSSIVMTVGGIFVIATYDGPQVSDIRATLLGRPPVMARMMVLLYGLVAVIMIFKALGLTQFLR